MIIIHGDAAYNPQTKEVGIGIIVQKDKEQVGYKFYIESLYDNHLAEFLALYLALKILQPLDSIKELLQYRSDSKILIQSLDKGYVKRGEYNQILSKILTMTDELTLFFPKWVPEKENQGADHLARQALLKQGKLKAIYKDIHELIGNPS